MGQTSPEQKKNIKTQQDDLSRVEAKYATRISAEMLSKINADPGDAVAKQFVPTVQELNTTAAEQVDPIADELYSPVKGVVHRHDSRCLLKPVSVCPVYCRFCFRREMIGPGNKALTAEELATAYDYIRDNPQINEVILTGGDPLILKPKSLNAILTAIEAIPHIQFIRIHTRVPVVEPRWINDDMLKTLTRSKALYLSIHTNHVDEWGEAAIEACCALRRTGSVLLSQTVLLKDVNDNVDALADLMNFLLAQSIKPYYLHHADLAPGTQHFRTRIADGQALLEQLRSRVSGLAMPHYVLDIPGGFGKIPLNTSHVVQVKEGEYYLQDFQGNQHHYCECVEEKEHGIC